MVSAIILTKNEEKNIIECLQSLSWCDEKIVIDDESQDQTAKLAEKSGAKVYIHKLSNFSDQRNFALEKAKGEWLLFIDADERVSPELWYEIMEHINDPIENYSGFLFKRIDIMWGKQLRHGEVGNLKLLRLARKNSGKWHGLVHEKWKITGGTGRNAKIFTLKNPLYHYPHKSVKDFLQEINLYTDLRAKELYKKRKKTNFFFIILYPKAKFIQNFIFRLGFLDGIHGFIFALMMSFHSFLVRSKLWLLLDKKTNT